MFTQIRLGVGVLSFILPDFYWVLSANSFVFMSFCSVTGSTIVFLKQSGRGPLVLIPLHLTVEESWQGWICVCVVGEGALADGNACLLFRDSAAWEDREHKSWPMPGTLLLPSFSDDVSGISKQGVCSLYLISASPSPLKPCYLCLCSPFILTLLPSKSGERFSSSYVPQL